MEFPCHSSHIKKVIVDASFLDKGALGIGNKLVHVRSESSGHHLGDKLGNGMDKAYWAIIGDLIGAILFLEGGQYERI